MKPGRNDPCPCGSGKKYKACCLAKAEVSTDFLYDKLSDAYNRLSERMLQFAHKVLGEYGLSAAMAEFLLWPEDDQYDAELDRRADSHSTIFFPWLLFNWVWDPDDFDERSAIPINMTIAEAFLKDPKARLDPLEKRIIEATIEKPFSFYEVIECRPNRGFRLKDVFLGEEVDVSERSGSHWSPITGRSRPGVLHRGNGGYLLLDALVLLRQPLGWEGLKQALRDARLRIEATRSRWASWPRDPRPGADPTRRQDRALPATRRSTTLLYA